MKRILFILICACALCSCHLKRQIIDTTYVSNNDSVRDVRIERVFDSVYIDRWHTIFQRGDTVFVRDSTVEHRLRDAAKIDTFVDIQSDTIRITETTTEYIPRERSGYDRFVSWGFWILLSIGYIALRIWIWKRK